MGLHRPRGRQNIRDQTRKGQWQQGRQRRAAFGRGAACGRGADGLGRLTSRERIRYRTIRPRSTASVWLSKSGELMPVAEEGTESGRACPSGTRGTGQGSRGRGKEGGSPPQKHRDSGWGHRSGGSRGTALRAPASSPVMLSTSTCHLCSSCSSWRISRFWRRSATVSSGVRGAARRDTLQPPAPCSVPLYWYELLSPNCSPLGYTHHVLGPHLACPCVWGEVQIRIHLWFTCHYQQGLLSSFGVPWFLS